MKIHSGIDEEPEKELELPHAAEARSADSLAELAGNKSQDEATESFWMPPREPADSGFMDALSVSQPFAEEARDTASSEDRRVWQVDLLTMGAWVDLMVGTEWVRAQLTWASPQRSLFLFISGTGSTHSMSRNTLDKLKEAGRIRLVTEGRVMDRALDAVAQVALDNELRAKSGKEGQ